MSRAGIVSAESAFEQAKIGKRQVYAQALGTAASLFRLIMIDGSNKSTTKRSFINTPVGVAKPMQVRLEPHNRLLMHLAHYRMQHLILHLKL